MAVIPDSTKSSLDQRLMARARERWPQVHDIALLFRGRFAYVDTHLIEVGELSVQKLCRLRYGGSAHLWGFPIYRASYDYDDSVLPNGLPLGSAEEASTPPAASNSTTRLLGPEPPTNLG
jgi:hypothetical protein